MAKSSDKKTILISNDDGIRSEGIKKLAAALRRLGTVYVVAPDRERSAAGHSLTLHRPLRIEEVGLRTYAVDGTPTDCVTIAVNGILPARPDIVVSGINRGANLGEDVTYSGTVSAAMEGTLMGIPSFAISLAGRDNYDFRAAAAFAVRLSRRILNKGLPKDTLLNINVPAVAKIKGHRITRQGKRSFSGDIVEKLDPRNRKYYWIGGDMLRWEGGEDSDFHVISKGYISITPLHLDLTNYASMKELKDWQF
ncbi:MAG: 5'/3'-nucleotidase SurE [Deltaproteobacteria bacterium RIFCSPLOWO2_02_FULL_53_8]|nr:MAG: 5'/3'-nucleotidase SurE [Deltaproteobacteria bacterium RIFCSPLOWO2_02_FULL_53_8]